MKLSLSLWLALLLALAASGTAQDAKKANGSGPAQAGQGTFIPAVGGVGALVFSGVIIIALMVLRYYGSIITSMMTHL